MCQLATKQQHQSEEALGQTIRPALQQLFSSWILNGGHLAVLQVKNK